jgi:hypothetical protein
MQTMTINNPTENAIVYTPAKAPKKRGRKRKTKPYFTMITQTAICAYNKLGDDEKRRKDRIYNRFIHYPLYKLAEIVYNSGNYGYIDLPVEDIKCEMIAHMTEKLFMYQPGKGKAFSYFNRMVKNELIQRNQKAYKKVKITTDVSEMDSTRNILAEETQKDILSDHIEFIDIFIEYVDTRLGTLFNNRRDIMIADSFLELFRNRALIENYNKKALYVLVRERSRCDQPFVTKVVNTLKKLHADLFKEFQKNGKIIDSTNDNNFFL